VPSFLQPPLVNLGIYCVTRTDLESYQTVLHWLLERGYEPTGDGLAFRAVNGRLPWFRSIETHRLSEEDVHVLGESSIPTYPLPAEWLPVSLRLRSTREDNVDIDLEYAPIRSTQWERLAHSVQIVASGSDLNLMQNVGAQKLPNEERSRAERTDRWITRTFRALCDDLQPDYAGCMWEWSLPPPAELMRSKDVRDFVGLYVARSQFAVQELQAKFAGLEKWAVHQFDHGLYFESVGRLFGSAEGDSGMEHIRVLLQENAK